MAINFISRTDELIIVLDNVPYVIARTDKRFDTIKDYVINADEESLRKVLSTKYQVQNLLDQLIAEGIEQVDTDYYYLDNPIPMDLSQYLHSAIEQGSWSGIVNFIKRLFKNPSYRTRQDAFAFMERNKLPIQEDGRFLAFRVVTDNYLDKYTRTMSNAVGQTVEIDWDMVDTNPDITCSRGLHACSKDYLQGFYSNGDRIIAVAIGPEDIGAIPSDYNGSKLRCRKFEVMEDITEEVVKDFNSAKISGDYCSDRVYEEDDYEYSSRDRW